MNAAGSEATVLHFELVQETSALLLATQTLREVVEYGEVFVVTFTSQNVGLSNALPSSQ